MLKFDSDIGSMIYAMNEEQRNEFYLFMQKMKQMGLDGRLEKNFKDFTCKDVMDKIDSVTEFEKEQEEKKMAAEMGVSTIPNERWGTHESHCCVFHGCKYGDVDCPVVLKIVEQDYPCETCSDGMEDDPNRIFKKKK